MVTTKYTKKRGWDRGMRGSYNKEASFQFHIEIVGK